MMLLSLLAITTVAAQSGQEMRLMRFPTVHGDTVVFSYAGDLWSADRKGGLARQLTTHPGGEAYARFSPDGKWIAFTGAYDGNADVFVIPAEGGEPKRLTFDPGSEVVGGWTPDGRVAYKTPAFTPGNFTAGLRTVSPTGGVPQDSKLYEVSDFSFSPDGKQVVYNRSNSHNFNWRRYRGGTQGRISFSDLAGSFYFEIPAGRENSWQPMWVGEDVYYISDKNQGTRNLYRYNTKSKKVEQLTKYDDADIKWPSTDGKTIVFERDGYLYAFDIATEKVERLNPMIRSDRVMARAQLRKLGGMLNNFSISPSGNRLAVETRGEIFSVPAKTGDTRPLAYNGSSSKEYTPAWSPDGQTVAFLSDKSGEVRLYTVPQMGGDWKELKTDPSHRIFNFRWAPDGKKISYSTFSNNLYVLDVETGKTDHVFVGDYNNAEGYDWSPDSKWIAYITVGKNLFGATYLYSLEQKKSFQVTEGYYQDTSVSFDMNGKYLYIVSSRTYNASFGDFDFTMDTRDSQRVYLLTLQKELANPLTPPSDEEPEKKDPPAAPQGGGQGGPPAGGPPAGGPPSQAPAAPAMKIDIEGLGDRALPLPWPAGSYGFVLGGDNGVFTWTGGMLKKFDLGARQSFDILGGANQIDFNPKRTKMAFRTPMGLAVSDVRPGVDPNQGRVNLNEVEGVVDPQAEWKQMFREGWRWYRDKFYDADMLGLDWAKIGKQYEAYLPYVSHRSDLNYVLGLMIGEMGTGHSYVGGGDMGAGVPVIPTGALGADYEKSGNHVRFKKIFKGLNFEEGRRGPLGEPGIDVKEGDYLLAIDGVELDGRDPNELLVGKANRLVTLTVNNAPALSGARKVRVRTIASEQQLRYIEWVEGNRKKVAQMTGGRVGYMHVPDTGMGGVTEFLKGFYSQSDKEAMIIDERFNGGGMIPTFFIEKLQRTINSGFRARNSKDVFFPNQTLEGPKVMLINEYAGSGGDLFPWYFRYTGLGPLIGNRTWGGLVGISGSAPLVDGGQLFAPEFGLYDVDKGEWIAENKGIDPDIQVDLRPDLLAKGEDPQLAKAVEVLLEALKKGPRPIKRPDFPRVKVSGQGG